MARSPRTTVTFVGTNDLRRQIKRLADATAAEHLAVAAEAGALPVQNAAKAKAPKRSRTLARSIHTQRLRVSRTRAEVAVGTDVVYARIQEEGGAIVPTRRRWLRFEVDGRVVFARRVVLPARPYLRPALDENRDVVQREIGQALAAQIGSVAR